MESGTIRILIIDDEEIICNVFSLYLRDMGYDTVAAQSGDDGLGILYNENEKVDLVLLDLNMPGKSGFEVLDEIRTYNEDIPVIIISGVGVIEEAMKAINMGAWDFVTKPVKDFAILNHHIQRAMERVRLLKSNRIYQNYLEDEVNKRIRELKKETEIRQEAETKYKSIFDSSNDAIIILKDEIITDCNQRALEVFAADREYLIGRQIDILNPEKQADGRDSDEAARQFINDVMNGVPQNFEWTHKKIDGSPIWVDINLSRVSINDEFYIISIIRDITGRKSVEDRLRLLSMAIEHNLTMVVIANPDSIIEYVNPKFCEITGYSRNEVVGQSLRMLKSGLIANDIYDEMWKELMSGKQWQGEVHNRKKNGDFYWVHSKISPIKGDDNSIKYLVVLEEDISVRKEYEDRLIQQANYDSLTSLPNRILLLDRMGQEMARAKRQRRFIVLMLIDLDNFKKVNDYLGHAAGDDILKEVAARLQKCIRHSDTIARFSGDKFFILLQDLLRPGESESIAEKILQSIKDPFILDDNEFSLTASIGLTVYPADGDNPHVLMKNADAAMYRSKEAGKNRYSFFSSELNERAIYRLQIENNLRYALEKQEFYLMFQPQISLVSGNVVGAECLLRWKNAEMGNVPPDAFIPIAEETGMIIRIGAFVLSEACREAMAWQEAAGYPIRLSVNVSSKQFRGIDFHTMVQEVLETTGYSAKNLEIEITESILITDVDRTVQILNQLVKAGISISVDDFGTGYSSLSYLKRFPVATLKIDKSFINNITTDAGDQALSKAIIAMGHSLGMEVIAEGVEMPEQIEMLKLYNCDTIQGYFYSRPILAEDFLKFLKDRKT